MGKLDITQKSFFENAEHFADLMNGVYFGGKPVLKAEELTSVNSVLQKADEEVALEKLRDVVKMQTKDGRVFALYVLENQYRIDYSMLVRIMVEESLEYENQVKAIRKRNKEKYRNVLSPDEYLYGFRKRDRLYPIHTLVLYWGDKEWDAIDSLRELTTISVDDTNMEQCVAALVPDYRIRVYDLNKVEDFSDFRTTLRTLFEFYSKRKDVKELKEYMKRNEPEIRKLDKDSRFLLATLIKEKRLVIELQKQEEQKEKEEEGVCKAIDDMIEEGRMEGMNAGRIKGKVENVLELLEDVGQLSESLKKRISEETNLENLSKWLKLAARSKTIADFEAAM